MKKVIFIAGTSYSGTTFLDMTLGNDPKGFSIGEVNALFEPYRAHHFDPVCGCYEKKCQLWNTLKQGGINNLYQNIFDKYPELDFIVDSSKEPLWIDARIKELQSQGIGYEIALIWKTPLEIAYSFNKRNDYGNWVNAWVNYHRLLYTLQPHRWSAISYHDYTHDPSSLQSYCEKLGIAYFQGKENFWEKKHHILFGNHSARKHLAVGHKDNRSQKSQKVFQKITYENIQDETLIARVNLDTIKNSSILAIENILESLTAGESDALHQLHAYRINAGGVLARQAKQQLLELYAKRFKLKSDKLIAPISYTTEQRTK